MGTQLLIQHNSHTSNPIFGPRILWRNGWMDEDATWYGSRSRPRPHCVRQGPSSPAKGAQQSPLFGPCLLWPQSPISATAKLLVKNLKTKRRKWRNLLWVHKYKVDKLWTYAWKMGVKQHCLTPTELIPLTPCFRGLWVAVAMGGPSLWRPFAMAYRYRTGLLNSRLYFMQIVIHLRVNVNLFLLVKLFSCSLVYTTCWWNNKDYQI